MPMLAFVANQLGISPALAAEYAQRDETRREHVGELQSYLGLRSFRLTGWRACLQAGTNAAWATDRGEPIVQALVAHLRAASVMIPTVAVLERIGLAARARARKQAFDALGAGLSEADRQVLEALLRLDPDAGPASPGCATARNLRRRQTCSPCWTGSISCAVWGATASGRGAFILPGCAG